MRIIFANFIFNKFFLITFKLIDYIIQLLLLNRYFQILYARDCISFYNKSFHYLQYFFKDKILPLFTLLLQ